MAVLGSVVQADLNADGVEESVRLLTQYTYNSIGRQATVVTGIALLSGTTNFALHPNLETASLDSSAAQTTWYEYDAAGNQTAVISTAVDDPDNPGYTTHLQN